MPWWVLLWIKRFPLIFLILSAACFSVGLVLFAYSSQQHRAVSVVTTVLSAFSGLGLTAVSFWFASERLASAQRGGEAWITSILSESRRALHTIAGWSHRQSCKINSYIHAVGHAASEVKAEAGRATDVESPEDMTGQARSTTRSQTREVLPSFPAGPHRIEMTAAAREGSNHSPQVVFRHDRPIIREVDIRNADAMTAISPAVARFRSIVRSVIQLRKASQAPSINTTATPIARQGAAQTEKLVSVSRLATLISKLKATELSYELAAHQALVRHMQFSPDGQYLATTRYVTCWNRKERILNAFYLSWDRTSAVFHIGVRIGPFDHSQII